MNEERQAFKDKIDVKYKEYEKKFTNFSHLPASEIAKKEIELDGEYKKIEKAYSSMKATECDIRQEKRIELLKEYSHSKVEQILRVDDELVNLKFKLILLAGLRNQLKVDKEITKQAYFNAKM